MARPIEKDKTIIDYIDLSIKYHDLTNKELFGIMLDKDEWVQFMLLYKLNYKECAVNIDVEEGAPIAIYRTVHVWYDGKENGGYGYRDNLEMLSREIEILTNLDSDIEYGTTRWVGTGTAAGLISADVPSPVQYVRDYVNRVEN